MQSPNRLLLISFDPFNVRETPFLDSPAFSERYSGNIGNLAFSHAGSSLLGGEKTYVKDFLRDHSLKDIDENFDAIVFPAANNLNSREDLGWLVDIIQASSIPVFIFGIGAQAPMDGSYPQLPQGTLRFLELIRKRSIHMLVRGEFTKKFLESMSISSTVIGCPSNFLSPNLDLGQAIEDGFSTIQPSCCAVIANLEYFGLPAKEIQKIIALAGESLSALVLQSDEAMFSILRDLSLDQILENNSEYAWRASYFTGSEDLRSFYRWVKRTGRIFGDLTSWLEHCRHMDLSVGSRFHGNMISIQAGTPAIVFYHDSRTHELAKTTLIPSISWEDALAHGSLEELLESIRFSGRQYNKRRYELAGIFVDKCRQLSIEPVPHLLQLATMS